MKDENHTNTPETGKKKKKVIESKSFDSIESPTTKKKKITNESLEYEDIVQVWHLFFCLYLQRKEKCPIEEKWCSGSIKFPRETLD